MAFLNRNLVKIQIPVIITRRIFKNHSKRSDFRDICYAKMFNRTEIWAISYAVWLFTICLLLYYWLFFIQWLVTTKGISRAAVPPPIFWEKTQSPPPMTENFKRFSNRRSANTSFQFFLIWTIKIKSHRSCQPIFL